MIRALQKRFVIVAMAAVTLLLVVLLGGINVVSLVSSYKQNTQLLQTLLAESMPGSGPGMQALEPGRMESERMDDGFLQPPMEDTQRSAVYFVVWVDDGEVVRLNLSRDTELTPKAARSVVEGVLSTGKTAGWQGGYRYGSTVDPEGTTVYVFLDLTLQRYDALRLVAFSCLGGLAGWGVMLVVVIFLSRRALAPMVESMHKQRQFITDAGHELKTPLAIIQVNLDALELLHSKNKWTGNIRQQVQRLDGLMQDLLTLARLEEGGLAPAEPVELQPLVEQALGMFEESFALRSIDVGRELEPATVTANRGQLQRLLSILLDNAAKYAPDGGQVLVRLSGGKGAVLRVENTCQQLPQVPPEQLFDRFYRADAARNQSGGYGIGLSAAQAIVTALRGTITAEYVGSDRIAFTVKIG